MSVNIDSSHLSGIPFSSTVVPNGPHTVSTGGFYKRPKINRKKINKISRKYKMKGNKRTIKKRVKRIKRCLTKRYKRSSLSVKKRSCCVSSRRKKFRGGQPNYPAGHSQYQNNNGSLSNTYSLGGKLDPSLSALANPVPYQKVAGDVDNLNHNALNSYGNVGAGSGFASKGWF
jgi:hypothetical protein